MANEVLAAIISVIALAFFGLIGALWWFLWNTIEDLRQDVSDLREKVISEIREETQKSISEMRQSIALMEMWQKMRGGKEG